MSSLYTQKHIKSICVERPGKADPAVMRSSPALLVDQPE